MHFAVTVWFDDMCRDSSIGIATRYGLYGPGSESRWGARFSAPVQTFPGAHPASYIMGTVSFPGVKWPRRGVDHPLASSAKVKERAELYLCSPSGPSSPVLGGNRSVRFTRPATLRYVCPQKLCLPAITVLVRAKQVYRGGGWLMNGRARGESNLPADGTRNK